MAKKEATESTYECTFACTYNVPLENGKFHNHFFKAVDDTSDPDEAELSVPKGTVVCKHFRPANDQAEADRKAQIETPAKYIFTKECFVMLAEIMVKEGFFSNRASAEAAIQATVPKGQLADSDPEETKRIAGVADLMSRGEDDKERRKLFGALLKKGKVTYFPGGQPNKLAELVYDNDLYVAPSAD
jgi:hypothetical protein